LQNCLNNVEAFTGSRQLSLAPSKCQHLAINHCHSSNN